MTSIVTSGIYPDIGTYSLSLCVYMWLHMLMFIYITFKKVWVYVGIYVCVYCFNFEDWSLLLRLEWKHLY